MNLSNTKPISLDEKEYLVFKFIRGKVDNISPRHGTLTSTMINSFKKKCTDKFRKSILHIHWNKVFFMIDMSCCWNNVYFDQDIKKCMKIIIKNYGKRHLVNLILESFV